MFLHNSRRKLLLSPSLLLLLTALPVLVDYHSSYFSADSAISRTAVQGWSAGGRCTRTFCDCVKREAILVFGAWFCLSKPASVCGQPSRMVGTAILDATRPQNTASEWRSEETPALAVAAAAAGSTASTRRLQLRVISTSLCHIADGRSAMVHVSTLHT